MFAVATTSKDSKNNVRAHITKYRNGTYHIKGQKSLIQVDTAEYRELHRLVESDLMELERRFVEKPATHKIDIQTMTLHSMDCEHIGEDHIIASIKDTSSTGLNICEHCLGS